MKAFFILIKIITVGLFWSIFFLEGVRVIMYQNWRFDILNIDHWKYARDLWLNGWVINKPKEWAFVLILVTSIPLWLTGWASLCMIKYSKAIKLIFGMPALFIKHSLSRKTSAVANKIAVKTVAKKKSHKEVRPPARDGGRQVSQPSGNNKYQPTTNLPASRQALPSTGAKKASSSKFEHALFDFDDVDDDFNFDLDAPIEKAPKKEKAPAKKAPEKKEDNKKLQTNQPSKVGTSSVFEVIKEKGYDLISTMTIKNTLIDFIGFSKEKIILFLVDKEAGDWLADEEKFNGEEPLWFSENSHRISPVRKVDMTRELIAKKVQDAGFSQEVDAFVVNQMNNIINAEDMLDIWKKLNVSVTRIDRGTPKELPLLAKALQEPEEKISKEELEKIKKIIRGIN